MAGRGDRTRPLGEFKPFIEIKNHKILSWFISSIKGLIRPEDVFVLITTEYFFDRFCFKEKVDELFQYHRLKNKKYFINTKSTPRGTSETILKAEDVISVNRPVTVIHPDQYINFDMPKKIQKNTGYLGLYLCFGSKTGFVKIENGLITKFVERKNISNIASCGVFISSGGKALIKAIKKQIASGETINGEYYIGPSFNYLIESGYKIYPISVRCKYDLGNVEGIKNFKKSNLVCG